jgi:3-keto-5-aminohexanoate cleavage enzyme
MRFEYDRGVLAWAWQGVEEDPEVAAELQPRWNIDDRVAIVGDLGHVRSVDEAVDRVARASEIGACAVHLHLFDDAGIDTGDLGLWSEFATAARSRVGDMVIDAGLRPEDDPMARVRAGVLDIVPLNVSVEPDRLRRNWQEVTDLGATPEAVIFDTADVILAKTQLFRPGVVEGGVLWLLDPNGSYHGTPMPGPHAMVAGLSMLLKLIEELDPDPRIVMCAAGRASSFLTTLTLLFGYDIRPGTGETHWRHPHTDDREVDAHLMIEDAVSVARGVGRSPLTVGEFRDVLSKGTS